MNESRASRRYRLRKEAFAELTESAPGDPRKIRRSMALDLSKRWYHNKMSGNGIQLDGDSAWNGENVSSSLTSPTT